MELVSRQHQTRWYQALQGVHLADQGIGHASAMQQAFVPRADLYRVRMLRLESVKHLLPAFHD